MEPSVIEFCDELDPGICECSPGCNINSILNSECDSICNVAECEWDNCSCINTHCIECND